MLSIIIPVFNESESLRPLHREISMNGSNTSTEQRGTMREASGAKSRLMNSNKL